MITSATLALVAILKSLGVFALLGGGILAGAVAVALGAVLVVAALVLGVLAGTVGLALCIGLLVALVLAVVLFPLGLPVLLLYLLVRPRRRTPGMASSNAARG